ncbi:MAG: Ni/Fe hydrogenase subunit alpha [Actinobacteria bacterium]|nr:Ni/Fe hydrogenase subunit alpha [Actinomycetota bacterium]
MASNGNGNGRRITIDPITRLEGHGKIEIFLDDVGEVDRAYFQVPELRGFEQFAVGRPVEDMPQITARICGVCPTAHHMAATKAIDALYGVEPPPAGRAIREMIYSAFMAEDHALHFYFLGGPDFVVGPDAPPAERNVLGVIAKVGEEVGLKVIGMRRRLREIITLAGGKVIHPVFGLPGGVSRRVKEEEAAGFREVADDAVEFATFTLDVFRDVVLGNAEYVDLITSDAFTHRTHYMGLVDGDGNVNFYDGTVRVVGPDGGETVSFTAAEYADHIAEHVEPWTYVKFPYLKSFGWQGFVDGPGSGLFSVAPLARLNAADGMATPLAAAARDEMFETLGGRPVHHTLANHWARVVELLYAAERLQQITSDPVLTDPEVRVLPTATPTVGMGVVEAPRGTLFHHYETDERGIVTAANLIVATQNNAARIAMSVDKAAKGLISAGKVDDGILNKIEMAFRAYDPCHACATHSLPGSMPLLVTIRGADGEVVGTLGRDADGRVTRG